MSRTEKISVNTNCNGSQNADTPFLCIYINYYVQKFRTYNSDEFNIVISGLKKFIPKNDNNFLLLIEQLKQNNFKIAFEGNTENINELAIICENITNNTSFNFNYQIHNLPSIVELSSKTDIPLVGIIITKIVAQIISKLKTLYKAIVLDLDETLWNGTLSEDGTDKIRENMFTEKGTPFIEFMKFVKNLGSELGVFIAICSRNDPKMVESTIDKLEDNIFPLKNQIDFIIANNNDKSENIRIIAKRLSILPSSIVFIDDNQIVRDEVKRKLTDVFVPEWSNHNELITQLIAGCIFERIELSEPKLEKTVLSLSNQSAPGDLKPFYSSEGDDVPGFDIQKVIFQINSEIHYNFDTIHLTIKIVDINKRLLGDAITLVFKFTQYLKKEYNRFIRV